MLEYRVLGGFAVGNGDGELSVGGPRQRRLVAMLLVHRNSVVSVDRLADVVFAGDPTPAAATTLRSYVARLRRVVEYEGSGSRVVTRAPGYRLEVPDDAVDGARFEAALAEGRALLARGESDAAARELRYGLGLWRGDAYAEFADEDWARGGAQRLAELRLVAYEELADAELGAGRPGEAASLLEGLVGEHPLRESLQARLMLSLYRSGRQVDALRAYQAHRDTLVAELGLEPAPELAVLEGRILSHDESLEGEAAGTVVRGYHLGERLGTGRDGTVFAARLEGLDRDLAVRVVPEDLADSPSFVRTFDADARRVAALRREGAIPVQDWWREPGAAYVVMQRMRGGTLRDRLQRCPMSGDDAARVVARVGGALVAAAGAGIGHGRLTAESVLFDDAGTAYLGDFALGTGVGLDGHGDLVALAALACEMVGGDVAAGRVPPVLAAALDHLPEPLIDGGAGSASRPAVPDAGALADFVAVTAAALADAPAGRRGRRPNPYKGLRAFDEPDAADFFGRDRVVAEITGRLGASGVSGRFVLVVGASGSGKSSVVRAGLLPSVRRGAVPGSDAWFVATMVPGKAPFEELADALRPVSVGDVEGLGAELAAGDEATVDRVVRRLIPTGGELLLVVDQLEELFTLAPDDEQRRFLDALVHAVSAPMSRLRVVATLRADYYDRPLGVGSLADLAVDATVAVGVMTAAEIESAVVGPAERAGVAVEPALLAELVGAVLHAPAGLPSLQFTLTELAERTTDVTLTLDAYRELGGVEGAIAARAEDLYLTVAPDARLGVRRMFEQLLVVGPEGEPTRRRALLADVVAVLPGEVGEADGVVEVWAGARLLTLDHHPDSRAPTVEVAHEALLREWPRLRDWVAEDRNDLAALAHLREAATGWEALDRDPGGLYRGTRLDGALGLAEARGRSLPLAERAFLDASSDARNAERRREAGRVRRLRAQLGTVAVALVASLIVGAVAVDQRDRAADQNRVAEARELAAAANANLDVDPERSVLLALAAVERSRGDDRAGGSALPEAEEALHQAVVSSRIELRVPGLGGWVAWSPAGDTFVTEGPEQSGEIDIRDAVTGESVRRFAGHDPDVNAMEYDGDGSLLVSTGDDGYVRVWDPDTGEQVQALAGDGPEEVWGPSLSPDGTLFAASWPGENVVKVAEVATGRVVREIRTVDNPFATAFDPTGDRVAVSSWEGAPAEVVDLASGETLLTFDAHFQKITDVAWSPDGTSIATAGGDGAAIVWDAETGERRFSVLGHEAPVNSLDWSPAGGSLATAGEDGTVKVWRVDEGGARELFTLTAQDMRMGVIGVDFSPDSLHLLTGAAGKASARVWDVGIDGDAEVANLPTEQFSFNPVAFLPPGDEVVAPYYGGSAAAWDVTSRTRADTFGGDPPSLDPPIGPSEPPPVGVEFLTVADDGKTIATMASEAGAPLPPTVRAWDVETGRELFATAEQGWMNDLALSPDGGLLAVSYQVSPDELGPDSAGWVTIYDRLGREVARIDDEPGFGVGDVRFAADDRQLVTARFRFLSADDRSVQVWDWKAGTVVSGFDTPAESWTYLAADGTKAASAVAGHGGAASEIRVRDVAAERDVTTLGPLTGVTKDVAFASDGSKAAVAGNDGTVRVFDARDGHELVALRGHLGAVSAVAFNGDGSLLASASVDGTVRVWALRLDDLEDIAQDEVTRSLTDAECRRYLHTDGCAAA